MNRHLTKSHRENLETHTTTNVIVSFCELDPWSKEASLGEDELLRTEGQGRGLKNGGAFLSHLICILALSPHHEALRGGLSHL